MSPLASRQPVVASQVLSHLLFGVDRMSWTKGQHVEHGTWWDREGDPSQEVLDARKRHGLNPDGSFPENTIQVVYCGKLYDVARSALRNARNYGNVCDETVKLETGGPSVSGNAVSGTGQVDVPDETAPKGFKVSSKVKE